MLLEMFNKAFEDQLKRYDRKLKPYIWSELCTNDHELLTDLMREADRIESAHCCTSRTYPRMNN